MDNEQKRGKQFDDTERHNDLIAGRNAVKEALLSGRAIDSVLIAKGERQGSLIPIIRLAKEMDIPVRDVAPAKLDALCPNGKHQGVAAWAAAHDYAELEDIFKLAEKKGEPPFIVIADGVCDPHNLGAIVRSAEGAGAHGVIIPKRRAAGLTWTVGKASAGALEYVPVVRTPNLAQCIDTLKKRGIWVCAADRGGEQWCAADMSGALAVVVGGEDTGVSRLVKDKCDFVVSLPMNGAINSLNASCACAIILYEAARQRAGIEARNKKQ